jgi:hypothetical protein
MSYHERREALEAGWKALGYRIAVTAEQDRTATVYIEDRSGWDEQTSYPDYEAAMSTWEARLSDAVGRKRAA